MRSWVWVAACWRRHPSIARGIVCGIAALGLGLFAEWKFFPMVKDDSFQYFLKHVKDLSPVTILMIGDRHADRLLGRQRRRISGLRGIGPATGKAEPAPRASENRVSPAGRTRASFR